MPFFFDDFALEERGLAAELLSFADSNRTIVAALVTASLETAGTDAASLSGADVNFINQLVFGGANVQSPADGAARGGASADSPFLQFLSAIAPVFQVVTFGFTDLGYHAGSGWWSAEGTGAAPASALGQLAYVVNPVNWWSLAGTEPRLMETAGSIVESVMEAGRSVATPSAAAVERTTLDSFSRIAPALTRALDAGRQVWLQTSQHTGERTARLFDAVGAGNENSTLQAIIDAVVRSLFETGTGLGRPLGALADVPCNTYWSVNTPVHDVTPPLSNDNECSDWEQLALGLLACGGPLAVVTAAERGQRRHGLSLAR